MDNSKLNQTELNMVSIIGNTFVNVNTGRLMYKYLDIDYGNGSNNLTISHVYNSYFELPNGDSTNMGKKWKLDIQEYVYYNPQLNVYQYYDGNGIIHDFKYLGKVIDKDYNTLETELKLFDEYYDTSETGLRLIVDEDKIVIKNLSNLTMEFIDNKIKKKNILDKTYIYEYDNEGYLIEYYENSNSSTKVKFSYNPDKLLNKMEASHYAYDKEIRNYYYLGTNTLKYICKDNTREAVFDYAQEQLIDIYDNISKQGFVIEYLEDKVSKLEKGLLTKTEVTKEYFSNYVGEDIYLGDDVYLGEKEKRVKPTFNINTKYQKYEFVYKENCTEVTNEDSITYVYYFNTSGFTTAIFEKLYSGSKYNYVSSVEPFGLMVMLDSVSEENDMLINSYSLGKNNLRGGITKSKLLYMDEEVTRYLFANNNYFCNFWINLKNKTGGSKVAVEITFDNDNVSTYEQIFDNELINSWQQITVPITDVKYKTLKDLKIKFQLGTLNDEVIISSVNIFPNNSSKLKLIGKDLNSTQNIEIEAKDILNIYYEKEITSDIENITNNNYFTENDLLLTCIYSYKNRTTNDELPTYTFNYFNNLKKCLYAKNIKFNTSIALRWEITNGTGIEGKKYKLPFYTTMEDNYYEFNKQIYIYSKKVLPGYNDGIECLCYENTITLKRNDDEDDSSLVTYEYYDFEGKLLYRKKTYYKNYIIKNKEEVYEYIGKNVKIYFKDEEDNDYSLSTYDVVYEYGDCNYSSTEISGGLTITNDYYPQNGMVKCRESYYNSSNIFKYNYTYNNNSELTEILIQNNNTDLKEVKMFYDENKKGLKTLRDENYEYSYEYDQFYGYLNKVTDKNDKTLFTQNINPYVKTINKNYNGKNITEKYDKYGLINEYTANGLTAFYNYYGTKGSKKNSKVKEINISNGEKYNYTYYDNNLLKSYTQKRKCDRMINGNNTVKIDVVECIDESTYDKVFKYENYELNSMLEEKNNYTPKFIYCNTLKNIIDNKINDKITNSKTEICSKNDGVKGNSTVESNYSCDAKNRLEERKIHVFMGETSFPEATKTFNIKNNYSYYDVTNMPSQGKTYILENNQERLINQMEYVFTDGNLSSISKKDYYFDDLNSTFEEKISNFNYSYDKSNRIFKEEDDRNNKTRLYEYNSLGNLSKITTTTLYPTIVETKEFIYNQENPNELVQVKLDNQILYDNIEYYSNGNWKSFNDAIGSYKLEYDSHNNLKYFKKKYHNETEYSEIISFEYDIYGRRTKKKIVNSDIDLTIEYFYDGNRLLWENRYYLDDACTNFKKMKIAYFYDKDGIIGFSVLDERHSDTNSDTNSYNQYTYYHYVKDVLGNIIGITDGNDLVVRYDYDAWGNRSVSNSAGYEELVVINPFGYRGYYYDVETQLFYCNSRYYSPELCRWISPDSIEYLDPESINGLNLYCYCMNNPIMYADPSGCLPQWAMWLIGGVVIAGLAIATIATGGAAGGVAGFILAGALKGAVVGAVSGALVNGTISGISSAIDGDGFWSGFADGAAHGFMSGAVVGGITGAISSGLQVAKAASYWDKGTFSSGYKSMKYHYTQEVVNKGLTKGNSIVKYTSDAVKFANNNGMNFTLNLSRNGLQNSWSLSRYFGSGANGLYTSSGNIITFHYFYMW